MSPFRGPGGARSTPRRAVALLPGTPYELWLIPHQERLRAIYTEAAHALAEAYLAAERLHLLISTRDNPHPVPCCHNDFREASTARLELLRPGVIGQDVAIFWWNLSVHHRSLVWWVCSPLEVGVDGGPGGPPRTGMIRPHRIRGGLAPLCPFQYTNPCSNGLQR